MDQSLGPCIKHNCFPTDWPYKHRLHTHHVSHLRHNGPNTQKAERVTCFGLHLLPHISLFFCTAPLLPRPRQNFLAPSAQSAFLSSVRCHLGNLTSLSRFVTGSRDRNKRFFNTSECDRSPKTNLRFTSRFGHINAQFKTDQYWVKITLPCENTFNIINSSCGSSNNLRWIWDNIQAIQDKLEKMHESCQRSKSPNKNNWCFRFSGYAEWGVYPHPTSSLSISKWGTWIL